MEAEKAVIGSLFTNPELITEIDLKPEMFTDEYLGQIFFEIKDLNKRGIKADTITVTNGLADKIPNDILSPIIFECITSNFFSDNITEYATVIQKDYAARELNKFLNSTQITGANIDNVKDMLTGFLAGDTSASTGASMDELIDRYSGERFTENRKQGLALGYENVDSILQNLDGGDMCIIAARPSVGKSAISTEIALNIAKAGHKVVMFNLEMSNEQVYDRFIAHESGIDLRRIRRAVAFLRDEREKYEAGLKRLKGLSSKLLFVDDVWKVSEMSKLIHKNKPEIAIIDYAQLIKGESAYRGNRYAEVGAISHSIKECAKQHNIPIILLAQLNRRSEQTETKEPTMGELREAGDFEQDASQIILLWNKNEERTLKGVKIDKNRQGEVGKTELEFDGKTMTFRPPKEDNPFY